MRRWLSVHLQQSGAMGCQRWSGVWVCCSQACRKERTGLVLRLLQVRTFVGTWAIIYASIPFCRLNFTSGAVAGKTMIVQATNTGGDLGENHFDLAMPGGGVGMFDACSQQWGGINLGNRNGGFTDRWQCSTLPWQWQQACYWRFDWFRNADNPSVEFEEVACPQAMIDRTGCGRWS